MEKNISAVRRERLPFLAGSLILTIAVAFLQVTWLTVFFGLLTVQVFWFFRDPQRTVPDGKNLVVSPADGKVVVVAEAEEERFLKGKAKKISIFLNVFDVHVNRVPSTGRVLAITYQPGKFLAADKALASTENEQNAVFLETDSGHRMVFIQIAGLIARRIVCWTREGSQLERGERYGMIRFGSRTDIFLPLDTEIKVSLGDRVKGGTSVIGVLK